MENSKDEICHVKKNNEILMTESRKEFSHRMAGRKKIEYEVDGIGYVVEELLITYIKDLSDSKENMAALHKVFINGGLVREVDLTTNQILKNDPKYEPWKFLHMDASTYEKMRSNSFIPEN